MLVAAVAIWLAVMALAWRAARAGSTDPSAGWGNRLVIYAGFVGPAIALAALIAYALPLTHDLRAGNGSLSVDVEGRQYWWRVTYRLPGDSRETARSVETANTLVLPVDERADLTLTSPDVIHSFWVPALAGKMDLIPGHTNKLSLEPTRTGQFRGQCAELCGTSHAYMAFDVTVLSAADFKDWLQQQAAPAREPESDAAKTGRRLFFAAGCNACHSVRGTRAEGRVGPDLTHYGSRRTLAAGMLRNTPENTAHWIRDPDGIKPGVPMPAFDHLDGTQIDAIALYLSSLE